MPLYEYECEACGRRFEVIQKFSDPPVESCTLCGKGPVRKLIASPAFQFKGSGWYVTDYARAGAKDKGDTKESKEAKEGKDTKEMKESKESKETKRAAATTEKTASKTTEKPSASTKSSTSTTTKSDRSR